MEKLLEIMLAWVVKSIWNTEKIKEIFFFKVKFDTTESYKFSLLM